jgi:hypothetical protein
MCADRCRARGAHCPLGGSEAVVRREHTPTDQRLDSAVPGWRARRLDHAAVSGNFPLVTVVRPLGFEPRTCGLRVRCSAIELEALGVTEGIRTPGIQDHNLAL